MHSKLKSSSPVCIQIGLFTLVELVYVEAETTSFRFPKVLAQAKPQGVVDGYNIFAKNGNAIGLQRLVDSCNRVNKKQQQEFGGGLQNFKFGRFPPRGKM